MKFSRPGDRITVEGVVYVAVPERDTSTCAGCAFYRSMGKDTCLFPKDKPEQAFPAPGCAVRGVIYLLPVDAVTQKLIGARGTK